MPTAQTPEQRFGNYIDALSMVIGHADRHEPLRAYCSGLLLPGDRKSVEPMAARIDPGNVRSRHQSMHHFIADAPWSDRGVLRVAREHALPAIEEAGPIEAWIIDDTSFPKKGTHSVGVARQYCGQLGKQENCQVAVSTSIANEHGSLPVAYQLYLPETWAKNRKRRRKAGVPDDIVFRTKPQIAIAQLAMLVADGVPRGVVLADAAYGNNNAFRDEVTALQLEYAVGIQATTTVWVEGTSPLPPKNSSTTGRPATRLRRDDDHRPVAVSDFALTTGRAAFRSVRWREGSAEALQSRFLAVRVRVAHDADNRSALRDLEWLLIEWPDGEAKPTKYWLSTVPAGTSIRRLVDLAKMRWRIERDYQELKDEIGLGHFEGRGWRGFHHHATMSIVAYAFLVAERGLFPPPEERPRLPFRAPRLPASFRPRGSPDPA